MTELTFDTLLDLAHGRFGAVDVACPICGPDRQAPANRVRRVLRIWIADRFATYCCARCGAHGYARAEGAQRYQRQAPKAEAAPDTGKRAFGLRLWSETSAIDGTVAENYLTGSRLISRPDHGWPISLRLHHGSSAMVAAVSGADHKIVAVQVTKLTATSEKVPNAPRKTYGRMADGAVRLSPCHAELALAEGVETALSYAEMSGVPTWAALGKVRFSKVAIPGQVRRLHLCADADAVEACEAAKRLYTRRGLDVSLAVPERGNDFNDMLIALARRRSVA
jgi:hypothetical protein